MRPESAKLIVIVVVSIGCNLKIDWTELHRHDVQSVVRVAMTNAPRKRDAKGADFEGFVSAVVGQAQSASGTCRLPQGDSPPTSCPWTSELELGPELGTVGAPPVSVRCDRPQRFWPWTELEA